MERGWSAKGLLKPLWKGMGGRDALAEATGIGGTTLSQYNSGKRPLGRQNAEKIAIALNVILSELGAPADMDPDTRTLADRLESLEATVERQGSQMTSALRALAKEVRAPGRVRELSDQPATRRVAR